MASIFNVVRGKNKLKLIKDNGGLVLVYNYRNCIFEKGQNLEGKSFYLLQKSPLSKFKIET